MNSKTKNISKLIKQKIAEIDSKAQVILYGSRARGNERADSDWDILILTDYDADLTTERIFRNKLYDLELELGESFSVFVYSDIEWNTKQISTPFYFNVTNEGIRL